jgi:dihydrofolate reductase
MPARLSPLRRSRCGRTKRFACPALSPAIKRNTDVKKVVVSEFLTLDGVMEAPHQWSFPFWSEESANYKFEELFASDALLLGRVTYQGFAAAWPGRTDEEGFADRINSLPKFVASTTLQEAEWNASLLKGDIAEEVSRLKQQPGQDILVFGSAELADTLRQHDLIDEYRLMVFPVVVGGGKRLFKDGSEKKVLKLTETKTFRSGVVVLTYVPIQGE